MHRWAILIPNNALWNNVILFCFIFILVCGKVGGICRNHVTNPTKKCQKTESWENDKCFYSGSDRKVPTQAHQPIVLI